MEIANLLKFANPKLSRNNTATAAAARAAQEEKREGWQGLAEG